MDDLREIHESLVNGQRVQMVNQINDYGLYDFFADYKDYLSESNIHLDKILFYFSDCVISYHRISNQ